MARKYHDAEWLRQKYHDEDLSTTEIAELVDVSQPTISDWLNRHDIETRDFGDPGKRVDVPEDELRRLYVDEGLPAERIGERIGCSKGTILNRLHEYGITVRETEDYAHDGPPRLKTRKNGYEVFCFQDGEETFYCPHHRLLAIADGTDPYEVFQGHDTHVHHENGVKWDNRVENLSVMDASEHLSLHASGNFAPADD